MIHIIIVQKVFCALGGKIPLLQFSTNDLKCSTIGSFALSFNLMPTLH